jgi:hypothetical protein
VGVVAITGRVGRSFGFRYHRDRALPQSSSRINEFAHPIAQPGAAREPGPAFSVTCVSEFREFSLRSPTLSGWVGALQAFALSYAPTLMKLVSYSELAKLRLTDFVGRDLDIELEESGMIGLLGLGGWERLGESAFEWRQGEPYQTAGISLDLSDTSILSQEAAHRIIERTGLPVFRGMTAAALLEAFGQPETDKVGKSGERFLRFVYGADEQYLFGCTVDHRNGLNYLFLARKDYCDDDDSL